MADIADRVEAQCETELSRLGSEKLLLAATEAEIRADTVAGALAATADVAATAIESWAETADDGDAAALQAEAADAYRDINEATLSAWPDAEGETLVVPDAPDGDWERVGAGLVGVGLVLDRLLLQAISFHVNEANTGAADRLREFRGAVQDLVDRADAVDEADHDAAVAGAAAIVESAYERYAARLDSMGMDPKPLC